MGTAQAQPFAGGVHVRVGDASTVHNVTCPYAEFVHALQVFTLDQLVTYLRKLLPSDASTSAAAEEKKAVEAPQGECDEESVTVRRRVRGGVRCRVPDGRSLTVWLKGALCAGA